MNVAALFDAWAVRRPLAPAILHDDGVLSYGELRDLAHRAAHLLATRGVARGDRVALLLPNHPAFPVALLGSLWLGATVAVLSPAWAPADAAGALALADARLLVTTEALAAATGADPASTLIVDDVPGLGSFGAELRAIAFPRDLPPAPVSADDVATILFSSGTTGAPKGVMLTHRNLAFNAAAKIRYCGIAPADRLAMVVPMAHCFGQNVVLLGALLGGAAVRLFGRFEPGAVHAAVARGEVSMLLASPTAFRRLLALGDATALRRLRYSLTAAAPLPAHLALAWREAAGHPLAQGYGLTECSPFATYQPDAADGPGVGRAIDGVELRVDRGDGEGWGEAGCAGEIAIRGPNVMAGYWRRPADSARVLRGGWLRTGDIGRLDAEGRLSLVDRVDDVINVAGFKAWPSDVERALMAHPAVSEAAAYGIPDADRGAAVAVAVVLHPGSDSSPDDLMRFAAERLAGFQRPVRLRLVDALPRNPSGKVLRRVLAAPAERDQD